jgi:hypothetical protein
MPEQVLIPPKLDGQQHPALATPAAYLIDLRTPTQAAVTTFSRPESAGRMWVVFLALPPGF